MLPPQLSGATTTHRPLSPPLPPAQVNNVRKLGGIVELVGESYQETQVRRTWGWACMCACLCMCMIQNLDTPAIMTLKQQLRRVRTLELRQTRPHTRMRPPCPRPEPLRLSTLHLPRPLQAHAVRRSATDGLTFVPPYDAPEVIAGQGTVGDEILRQVRHTHAPHSCMHCTAPTTSVPLCAPHKPHLNYTKL